MLWFRISGRAATTMRSDSPLPWKSGVSTSTRQPGACARISRITSAKARAEPRLSSSRLTLVTTACASPSCATAYATRRGSSRSIGSGLPLGTAQKPQRRVQRLPSIMKVAEFWFQHSPRLGQLALSHTVCSLARAPASSGCGRSRRRAHAPSATPACALARRGARSIWTSSLQRSAASSHSIVSPCAAVAVSTAVRASPVAPGRERTASTNSPRTRGNARWVIEKE